MVRVAEEGLLCQGWESGASVTRNGCISVDSPHLAPGIFNLQVILNSHPEACKNVPLNLCVKG